MRSGLKKMLAGVLFSAAVGMAPSAHALLYDFDFHSSYPGTVDFDMVIDVSISDGVCPNPTGCLITSIVNGWSPQYGTVTGLAPIGASINDNLFFDQVPYIDVHGIAFTVSGRTDYLGIYNNTGTSLLFYDYQRFPVQGQAFVSAIPEPETYAMLIAGLGLLGLLARRRQHRGSHV